MATRKIEKSDWQRYFDGVAKALAVRDVTIEVASLAIGDQILAESQPLNGISYDPKDDVLLVETGAVDHMIRRPREVYVEETGGGLARIETRDAEGTKQIITLTRPLLLARPG